MALSSWLPASRRSTPSVNCHPERSEGIGSLRRTADPSLPHPSQQKRLAGGPVARDDKVWGFGSSRAGSHFRHGMLLQLHLRQQHVDAEQHDGGASPDHGGGFPGERNDEFLLAAEGDRER